MTQSGDSTLDIIQRLSNERQQLYRFKWPKRQAKDYAQRIHYLDERLKQLWQQHRAELVENSKLVKVEYVAIGSGDYRSTVESTAARNVGDEPDVHPVTQLADALSEIGYSIIREVLAELREEREQTREVVPLRKVLARRGKTLQWSDGGRGRSISQVVNITAPS